MTPYQAELVRKSIHVSSVWIPLVMYFLPQGPTIALFALLSLGALGIEQIRRRTPHINNIFKGILREHEQGKTHNHVGATWTLIGALFASFFPDDIGVTAMAIIAISDACASLIGMRFGRKKILGKSLEGSAAFFLSGLIIIWFLGSVFLMPDYLLIAIPALAITTAAELASTRLKLDDNIFIPATMCISMLALAALL